MASKDELLERAQAAGVAGASDMTKDELEKALAGQEAAGPFVGADGDEPKFESKGSPIKGVQALEDDDVPEAGR